MDSFLEEQIRQFWAELMREKLKQLYAKKNEDPQLTLTLQSIKERGLN